MTLQNTTIWIAAMILNKNYVSRAQLKIYMKVNEQILYYNDENRESPKVEKCEPN